MTNACDIDFLANIDTDRVFRRRLEYVVNIEDVSVQFADDIGRRNKRRVREKHWARQFASIIWNIRLMGADGGAKMASPQSM